VTNDRHRNRGRSARQEIPDADNGIVVNRTYRRAQLVALLPGGSEEFIRQLEIFYGLLPLGGKQAIYFGENVIESLIRHARNEQVKQVRCRLTQKELRRAKVEQQRTRRP
jgi:hypothetical protein